MLEFKEYKLEDISTFEYGRMPDKLKLKNAGYPVYSGYRIVGFYAEYMFQRAKLLIIARGVGGTGNVRISPPFSYITNLSIIFNENEDLVDYRYLYYYLGNKNMRILDTGSCQSQITINQLEDYKVQLPSKAEQIKILGVLATIDSKIEINNQINAELEKMAKTLYDYWFVQFDFPDENGKPYRSSGGKMVWNDELKREIPDGWDSVFIENLLSKELAVKKIPSSEILKKGLIPVIDQSTDFIAGFTNDEATIIETNIPIIIFGDHTRILKLINFDFARGADGTQVLLSNNERMPQHLFYQSLLKIDLSNYGYARHFKFLKETRIMLPNQAIAQKYDSIIKSHYMKIKSNIFQNKTISELRDWLLPMLMNGQLRVIK